MSSKVILLAAGAGRRLRPYTDTVPKCQVALGGESLIERQMRVLAGEGLVDITIIGGYRFEQLLSLGCPVLENKEWASTNMVYTLWRARDVLFQSTDVIIAYSDIIYEQRVLKELMAARDDCSVIIDVAFASYWQERFDDPLSDAESLRMSEDGFIVNIGQKLNSLVDAQGQYIGLMRFKGSGLKQLCQYVEDLVDTKSFRSMYMTDLIQGAIADGLRFKAVPITHGWLEIDDVDDYEKAKSWFQDGTIVRFFDPNG